MLPIYHGDPHFIIRRELGSIKVAKPKSTIFISKISLLSLNYNALIKYFQVSNLDE